MRPQLLTLVLAHIAGSYGFCILPLMERMLYRVNDQGAWICVCLAPLIAPIYLVVMTVVDFPHYYNYMPEAWAFYSVPFVTVCLLRRKGTPLFRFAIPPIFMTLFVTALWLPRAIGGPPPWQSPLEGKQAPDFTLTTLDGTTCSISQEKGHVVLIDFWGTDCPPCRVELEQLVAGLANDKTLHERGLRVWAINIVDDSNTVQKFLDENHYDFEVMLGTQNAIANLYPLSGIPTTYLVARDGSIRKAFAGFDPKTDEQLRAEIEAALK